VEALLVSLHHGNKEIRDLISSAGYNLVSEVIQRREREDPRYFVGKGKLEEIRGILESNGIGLVIFNGELKPSQHYNLERELGVECFDRTRLILEIFATRARSREAQLQVELAQLQYQIPLLREWIHRAKAGEKPGFLSGGEYRVDIYYENIRRRMKRIKGKLELMRRERNVRRVRRRKRGFHLVSIAGYANAGKSSLLNALSGDEVLVDNRMFSTLSTTTRRIEGVRRKILLTDTVGFIDEVPLWLVDAFRSTLEEVYLSDVILLVVDASDEVEEVRRKVEVASQLLLPRAKDAHIIVLLNKVDLISGEEADRRAELVRTLGFHTPIAISALKRTNLDVVVRAIVDFLRFPIEVEVLMEEGDDQRRMVSWLHENAEVLSESYGRQVRMTLRCARRDLARLRSRCKVLRITEIS